MHSCPAIRRTEPWTLGDSLYKRRLELGLSQSATSERRRACRNGYRDYETDKWLPDHRTRPKVIGFLGFLPWPDPSHARLHLCRRALGLASIVFERRHHVSRYNLSLWETGQASINERIMIEVMRLVDPDFPAKRFRHQLIETGSSFLPARRTCLALIHPSTNEAQSRRGLPFQWSANLNNGQ
jgi:hypothetical protein